MEAIVNMACGLANRMFQYSYYLYLKKNGWQVAVDFYRKRMTKKAKNSRFGLLF